jgi:hypothetical protein
VGVVSRIVIGGGESPSHGERLDVSTEPAKETYAGHSRIGETCANLPAGNSNQGMLYALRGSEFNRGIPPWREKTARPVWGVPGNRHPSQDALKRS